MAQEIELPPDTLNEIKESEERIRALGNFLDKAGSAGMNVVDSRARLVEQKQKLARLKTAFFPQGL